MHDGDPLVGSLGVNLDGKVLAAECTERSLLYAARDFLDRSRATGGGEIFVKKMVRCRHRSFFISGLFPLHTRRPEFLVSDDGGTHRVSGAAMARVPGHLAMPLHIILIYHP